MHLSGGPTGDRPRLLAHIDIKIAQECRVVLGIVRSKNAAVDDDALDGAGDAALDPHIVWHRVPLREAGQSEWHLFDHQRESNRRSTHGSWSPLHACTKILRARVACA